MKARLIRSELTDVCPGHPVVVVGFAEFALDGSETKSELRDLESWVGSWLMHVWRTNAVREGCRRKVRHIHREVDVGDLPDWCRDRGGRGGGVLCARDPGGDCVS